MNKCVCMCVRERGEGGREGRREGERERERQTDIGTECPHP